MIQDILRRRALLVSSVFSIIFFQSTQGYASSYINCPSDHWAEEKVVEFLFQKLDKKISCSVNDLLENNEFFGDFLLKFSPETINHAETILDLISGYQFVYRSPDLAHFAQEIKINWNNKNWISRFKPEDRWMVHHPGSLMVKDVLDRLQRNGLSVGTDCGVKDFVTALKRDERFKLAILSMDGTAGAVDAEAQCKILSELLHELCDTLIACEQNLKGWSSASLSARCKKAVKELEKNPHRRGTFILFPLLIWRETGNPFWDSEIACIKNVLKEVELRLLQKRSVALWRVIISLCEQDRCRILSTPDTDGNYLLHKLLLNMPSPKSSCGLYSFTSNIFHAGCPSLMSLIDKEGRTPLHLAMRYLGLNKAGSLFLESFDVILPQGNNVDIQDISGKTALHYAVEYGCENSLIAALQKKGANPYLKDHSGKSPIDYALKNGYVWLAMKLAAG